MNIALVTFFMNILIVTSCDDNDFYSSCDDNDFYSSVTGEVKAFPTELKNGEKTILSIGGIIASSGNATINNKEYYPVIHYLIDGNEVAVSTEKDLPFNAKYIVENLSVGEHVLCVNITGSRKDAHYENKVKASTINVSE